MAAGDDFMELATQEGKYLLVFAPRRSRAVEELTNIFSWLDRHNLPYYYDRRKGLVTLENGTRIEVTDNISASMVLRQTTPDGILAIKSLNLPWDVSQRIKVKELLGTQLFTV